MVRRRQPKLPPPAPVLPRVMPARVRGNRAALLRAGVRAKDADEEAGGDLYRDYLPARAAARPRESVIKMHSPSTFGLDFFVMGKRSRMNTTNFDPDEPEGFLLLLQPLSYYLQAARVRKRNALVSVVSVLSRAISKTHFLTAGVHARLLGHEKEGGAQVRQDQAAGDRPGQQVGERDDARPPRLTSDSFLASSSLSDAT